MAWATIGPPRWGCILDSLVVAALPRVFICGWIWITEIGNLPYARGGEAVNLRATIRLYSSGGFFVSPSPRGPAMSKRLLLGSVTVGCCLFAWLTLVPALHAQESKEPDWQYGLEFRVRKAGEADFGKDTKHFGAEVFLDRNANFAVYITELGALATAPAATLSGTDGSTNTLKPPKWLHALELPVRKAGEVDFTKKTTRFGIEVFKDVNTGNLVYMSEKGDIAVLPGATITTAAVTKDPKRLHGLELKVRKGGEADWVAARRYGIEVFKDKNANTLVYICETGSIAVVPSGSTAGDQKGPHLVTRHESEGPPGGRSRFHGQDSQIRRRGLQGRKQRQFAVHH